MKSALLCAVGLCAVGLLLVMVGGCTHVGDPIDSGGPDAFSGTDTGTDAGISPPDTGPQPDVGPMPDTGPLPDTGVVSDAGVDGGPPVYTVVGTIGSVGGVSASTGGYTVVDDGFETGGMACDATHTYCVIGGIVP